MNDRHCLKIIANPYLFKKNKHNIPINEKMIEMKNNDLLYKYLERKYKSVYISPVLFYKIIEKIDDEIIKITIQTIIDEIINDLIHKFD